MKFKLFLYAVNQLKRPTALTDDEELVIKSCLSRIVNSLNRDYITIFKSILDESVINRITTISEKYASLPNFIDNSSKDVLDKRKSLSDTFSTLSMLNAEKIPCLEKRDRNSQTYQIIVILEYLLNSFQIWNKAQSNPPSELTGYRAFIPILEQVFADTDIIVRDGDSKSSCSSRHTQRGHELFRRSSTDYSSYTFGKKIDYLKR